MRIVMFGPPGSGKGTHGEMLAEKLGIPHISTGERLRNEAKKGTELGKRIRNTMDSGNFVDDKTMLEVLEIAIAGAENGYILDGYPRNMAQAEALERISAPARVIFIDVAESVIIARFANRLICRKCEAIFGLDNMPSEKKCPKDDGELYRRPDDSPEAVKKRLVDYRAQTLPLIRFYENKGILLKVSIEKEAPMAEVYERIVSAMKIR